MILVTVGSSRFPFARMNALIARLSGYGRRREPIIFQYGSLAPQYYQPPVDLFPYIPQSTLVRYMREARIIICHGGPATIYQALSFGTVPWVYPREKRYGEHLTDHQVHFCRFMAKKHLVRILSDRTPFSALLDAAGKTAPLRRHNRALIAYLHGMMNPKP